MSSLQEAQLSRQSSYTLLKDLNKWLTPPDHDDVQTVCELIGDLKSQIILLKRDIKRAEDEVNDTVEKPRSNEAKKLKNGVSSHLYDKIADLESELVKAEWKFNRYEYHLKMYQHALYHSRMAMKIDV